MKHCFVLFLTVSTTGFFGFQVGALKENRLVVLAFSLMTGSPPANGSMCRAAMQVAVNAANNRSGILGNYFIELDHRDELMGQASPLHVINFGRRFDIQKTLPKRTEYQSPVIIGNMITFGCASTGRFLHHVGLVSIAGGCQAPSMTNDRRRFPNIYRIRAPGELGINTRIQFIKTIGQWKEIAIITHAANSMDYYIAKILFNEAAQNGIHVLWFDSVYDFTDSVMQSLKDSDARVIAVETNQGNYLLRFLCQSYTNGLTGSRYLFIAPNNAYLDPYSVPASSVPGNPGCTREILIEQMKIMYFTGSVPQSIENFDEGIGPFGYSVKGFEERFDALTRGVRGADYSSRQICHDMMTQALLTLDLADQKLKKENLTLLSFAEQPQRVMRIVNESAGLVAFNSLRVPLAKYSPRLERDFDPQTVGYWFGNESAYRDIIILKANETLESIYNCESYKITRILSPPVWMTPNGLPPRDKWQLRTEMNKVPQAVFAVALSVAIVLGALQFFGAFYIVFKRNEETMSKTLPFSKLVFALGCAILNAGGVAYSVNDIDTNLCIVRYSLVAIGMALVNGFLFTKMVLYNQRGTLTGGRVSFVGNTNIRTSVATQQIQKGNSVTSVSVRFWETSLYDTHSHKFLDTSVVAGSVSFVVLNAVGIAVWQGIEPYRHIIEKGLPVYYYDSDTYVLGEHHSCESEHRYTWFAIVGAHLLLLAIGSILAIKLRSSPSANKAPEFNLTRAGIANATILACGTLMVVLILNNDYNLIQIVMAFASLIISASTSAIILLPTVKSMRQNDSLQRIIHS